MGTEGNRKGGLIREKKMVRGMRKRGKVGSAEIGS